MFGGQCSAGESCGVLGGQVGSRRRIKMVAMLAVLVAGCSHWGHGSKVNYATVTGDPCHDTEQAKAGNEKGLRLLEHGKLDEAEQAFQRALVADVTFGPAHNNLGTMYFQQGKFYLAAWEYEYASKLMPQRPEPYSNLGLVYETVNRADSAVDCYSLALELQPTNPEFLSNLARARVRRGDRGADMGMLLNDLVFMDSRPDWNSWAREQLVLGGYAPDATTIEPLPTPAGQPDETGSGAFIPRVESPLSALGPASASPRGIVLPPHTSLPTTLPSGAGSRISDLTPERGPGTSNASHP